MNQSPEVWPPAPGPQPAKTTETDAITCPECHRRLLTQTSALCNWCGAKIDNPDYQARAAQNRQESDQRERAELEAVIQEEAQHGILGRLRRVGKQNKTDGRSSPLG